MLRRKERLSIRSRDEEFESVEPRPSRLRDPQELRIYIKQLAKALKFLPLGSRAYYAVSGELLRANTQLRAITPPGSAVKGEH